ncbi:MAG: Lin1244/Lin1753 domain-containing protein [Butyricimonas faecalis]
MSKDAYYFTHDSNAKDDPKCALLIDQLGMEGYGIYWMLIEVLRDQPDYKYPLALLPSLKYNPLENRA